MCSSNNYHSYEHYHVGGLWWATCMSSWWQMGWPTYLRGLLLHCEWYDAPSGMCCVLSVCLVVVLQACGIGVPSVCLFDLLPMCVVCGPCVSLVALLQACVLCVLSVVMIGFNYVCCLCSVCASCWLTSSMQCLCIICDDIEEIQMWSFFSTPEIPPPPPPHVCISKWDCETCLSSQMCASVTMVPGLDWGLPE